MYKIFDMFASNGSTYLNKEYFEKYVLKNDIRNGDYSICNDKQIIHIKPDCKIDMFELNYKNLQKQFDMVYADPPHLSNNTNDNSCMVQRYTKLPANWEKALDNMFYNASQITNKWFILKWNENFIPIKKVLEIAKIYFTPILGTRIKTKTHWILMEVK